MSSIYESIVDPLRPNDAHGISLQLVGRGKSVLELGAAAGHVTKALKDLGNSVTAVERDGRFVENLSAIADNVIITDLDWLDLRAGLQGQTFDVILAGDVLEHCTRPDLVLHQCHDLLAPGGSVVVSLPNIAHADVRLSLLAGKFEYRQTGLLDSTHLRFFTRATIEEFALTNGFEIAEIFGSTAPLGTTEFGPPDSSIPREAIRFVKDDRDSLVYQYVLRLTPAAGRTPFTAPVVSERSIDKLLAELSLSQEALSAARANNLFTSRHRVEQLEAEIRVLRESQQIELADLRAEMSAAAHRHDSTTAELDRTIAERDTTIAELRYAVMQSRDHAIGAAAELGVARSRLEKARAEVESLVHQLNIVHSSRTWRIGRFVLLPLRGVRWLRRLLAG